MRRNDVLSIAFLAVLVAVPALATWWTDHAYLPRHPAARDVPWSQTPLAESVANEPDNRQLSDKIRVIHTDYVYAARALREGRIPEWNPLILGGVPHVANPMSAVFYPPSWLHLLVGERDIPLVAAALHVWLAAVFMLLFLRAAGLGTPAALFGGLGFALSGWVASHLQNTPLVATVVWLPLGWCGIELLIRDRRRLGSLSLGLAIGMPWLAGFPQMAALTNTGIGLYAIANLGALLRGPASSPARRGARLIGCVVAGILLAGVQLAPTMAHLPESARGSRTTDDLVSERFRPAAFLGLALPRTLGDPRDERDWREHTLARQALGEGPDNRPHQATNWGERTIYPGIAVLLLAFVGATRIRSRAPRSLLMVTLAGLGMACWPTAIRLHGQLPAFDFGAPTRAILLVAVALPALAALGLQAVLERADRPRPHGRGLLAAALLLGVLAIVMPFDLTLPIRWLDASLDDAGGLRTDLQLLGANLLVIAILVWLRPRAGATRCGLALITVLAIDLAAFAVPVNAPVSNRDLFVPTPGLRYLDEYLGSDRFMRVSASRRDAVADRPTLYHPNLSTLHDLRDAQGYRELIPKPYIDLWRGVPALLAPVGFSGIAADGFDSPLLDLAAVRYLIAAREIPALSEHRVYPDGEVSDLWIYENADAMPRVWAALRTVTMPDDQILERVHSGRFDLPDELLIAQGTDTAETTRGATAALATLVTDHPEEMVIEVTTDGRAYVAIADTWHPGWQATVVNREGVERRAPILRAMTCFRAVEIEAGDARVRLVYRTPAQRLGYGLGAVGIAMLLWLARRRPRG